MASRKNTPLLSTCLPDELENYDRRQLFKTGISLSASLSLPAFLQKAHGQSDDEASAADYRPLRNLVWIQMNGGWDILEVTDPKVASTAGIEMSYSWAEAHRVADSADDVRLGRWLPNIAGIGSDLLVVRGLAMGTTSHNAGRVYMETGLLSNTGRVNAASIPAIVASESEATIPIIQLNGGADPMTDRGLLSPVSVVRANNLNLYQGMYPQDDEEKQRKLALLDYLRTSLDHAQEVSGSHDRLTALSSAEAKVRVQFENDVAEKLQLTDDDRANFTSGAPSGMNQGIQDSFALTSKLLRNDLVTCINLGIGGFDTHSNQTARLQPTLTSVDFLVRRLVDSLRAAGRLDTTLIVLYSDFGRTPRVNNSNGRDHWPVGGALMMGGGIAGGRVVGATDDSLLAVSVDPESGSANADGEQLDPSYLGGAVIELTLGRDYRQLRTYLNTMNALTRLKSS